MFWKRLAERRWEEARASGALDDLPGRGKPLKLEDDSAVPEEWRAVFRLLRSTGHAPAWAETARQARVQMQAACADLGRALSDPADPESDRARRARARFEAEIREANDLIDLANRQIPHPSLRLSKWRADRLAEETLGPGAS